MIFLLILAAFATIFYLLRKNYQYWEDRGVPGPQPTYLLGNVADNFLMKKSLPEVHAEIYNQFPDAPLVGFFRAGTPTLIIKDPELIRDITVKSFQNFHDNDLFIDKKVDPLLGRNPFFDRGEDWKKTRVNLTPGFSSGKMKMVYPLIEDVSKQFVKYLENYPPATNGEGCKIKEACMRYTLNNVGICAFGLDAKCFEEDNPEFKQIADRFFSPEGWQATKVFWIGIIPVLAKFISIKFTPKDVEDRLTNIVKEILQYRQEKNIVRNDFLHIMHSSSNFDLVDVVAHAAGFFGDGYETSSIVLHFLLYELAANPEAQKRLREEVETYFERNNNGLPYEEVQIMPYLDACMNEALRLYPPLGSLSKVCTKPYTYKPKENDVIERPFVIEAETPVILSLYGQHRDPKYFDEPDSFKPERFLSPNKENIPKYTFMPFGEGPRACLGQRFGILQVKCGAAYVIKNFELSVNSKTPLPMKYDPMYFMTLPIGGLWLDFKKIA